MFLRNHVKARHIVFLENIIKMFWCIMLIVKYFVGYFQFISCLRLTFHSCLAFCYDQFVDKANPYFNLY